jgi:hypothetical protein
MYRYLVVWCFICCGVDFVSCVVQFTTSLYLLTQIQLNPLLGPDMCVEELSEILKGRMRTNAVVFKMLTDCYRAGALPVMEMCTERIHFSSVVSIVHEAILLQVHVSRIFHSW